MFCANHVCQLFLRQSPHSPQSCYLIGRLQVLSSGTIRLKRRTDLGSRLGELHGALSEILTQGQPTVVAIEDIFTAQNARSALALGQARGAALAAGGGTGIPLRAYAPAMVKRAVAGHGRADKQQIQRMAQVVLGLERMPTPDEADAMAVALCHAMMERGSGRMREAREGRGR